MAPSRALGGLSLILAFGISGCFCPRTPPFYGDDGGDIPGVDGGVTNCGLTGQDSDGDGLPDTTEDINGNGVVDQGECDPFDADTDGDGLTDVVEAGCDGLSKSGVDTRCDEADTDSDGLTDGYEDANGNGAYEPGSGETDPTNADSDDDGCTDGEEYVMMSNPNNADSDGDGVPDGFEDRDCDNVLEPDEGETDPTLTDTDGDMTPDSMEPTFICNPDTKFTLGGLRPVDFYEQENGDWRLALEADSVDEGRTVTYTDIIMTGVTMPPTDVRAGATFDYVELPVGTPAVEVAGFILSLPLDANGDGAIDPGMGDHIGVRDRIVALLSTNFGPLGGTSIRGLGNSIVSWEGAFNAVVNTVVEVNVTAGSSVGAVRNLLFPAFLGMAPAAFTNLPAPFGATSAQFVVVFETLWRADPNPMNGFPGRAIVMGAVAERTDYDDFTGKTNIRVSDLANGTGLAQYMDGDDYECDPFELVQLPVADIIWVDDDSGSTDPYRTSVKDNAVDLYDRAIAAGLDFRMGVISMGPTADGFCDPPLGATVPGPGVSCVSATPVPATTYNTTAGLGRWTGPTERDAFGWCICHPPDGDGGTEYGIYNGIKGVMSGLPRSSVDPRKIRPEATLVVIYVGDEVPQWPGYSMPTTIVVGSADWLNYVQPSIDMFTGVMNPLINPPYPAGSSAVDSVGRAHAIHDVDGSCGGAFGGGIAGVGYVDIVNAVGGVLGSVCAGSLGPTMQLIIDDIIGSASPIVLERTPISLSLACALDATVIERSRVMGFDYNAAANSVVFFGLGMVLQDADVACSYRYNIDETPLKEGMGGGPLG